MRTVAAKIAAYIDRLGSVWVEGQVTQITSGAGRTSFLTLRDTAADVSMPVTCDRRLLAELDPPLQDGARVVVLGRPNYYANRGRLSLRAAEIRPVGIGELLARIERLRTQLAAEGLFASERKRLLPFLPSGIGLITGSGSAAEHDVVFNARQRWPGVRFTIANTAVQGPMAVSEIVDALARLDADPRVEVIVIARGGGSVEDLLPFSDEALCRAVAAAGTPVVSAIGHEPDAPLLDHVADLRCSTPTAAAKQIVPDVAEEAARIADLRGRTARALQGWVHTQSRLLADLRTRPVLADPAASLAPREREVADHATRMRRATRTCVAEQQALLSSARSQLAALGPPATMARGYAVVQVRELGGDMTVLRSVAQVTDGSVLQILVGDGTLQATVSVAPDVDDVERGSQ